ncbi:hypothetical protein BDP81DRAFT_439146 [Colletotrichum phormii]|uniref:Uncharacterized protein n=1 Tax=Colletotrichum phormii TaxID=359342 RepID=A0AAJ0E9H6_9PEZI|nr:uncharacterized protein BDP81DRAFT_439146 [Colletotrichum phormii]KAK1623596.1 hypothetical protein BDP81DRAFT_439146 [Colletotrichum phormii]
MDRYFQRRIGCGMSYLNLDRMTTWGTPLYQAAAGGNLTMVKWLLEQKVDVDGPGRSVCHCMPIGKRASGRFARSFSASYRPAYTFSTYSPLPTIRRHCSPPALCRSLSGDSGIG